MHSAYMHLTGPSVKKAWVASPRQGSEVEEQREWWDRVANTLEVTNAERQAAHTQFEGLSWAVKYITEAVYHHFVVSREGLGEEREGTVVPEEQETQDAGVATSEVPNEGSEVPGSGCEGTED